MTKQSPKSQRKKMGKEYCKYEKCHKLLSKNRLFEDNVCTCCALKEMRKDER